MVINPRKYRRGGGVCIVADLSKVTIQPIDIPNPHNLEIVFALVKPKVPGIIKEIICFALYSVQCTVYSVQPTQVKTKIKKY